MRVFVVSPDTPEPACREKLTAAAALGCDVMAATPGGDAGTDGPIRLAPVAVKGSRDEPSDLRWHDRTLQKLLSEFRPDVVHVEAEPESYLAESMAGLCARMNLPLVLFSWERVGSTPTGRSRRRAERVLSQVAGVLGGSRRAEALLAKRADERSLSGTVAQYGITMPTVPDRVASSALRLGFVGRLVHERGPDRLIGALGQTYGAWELSILGTGPEQEPLERLAERHGLAARIQWLGGVRREQLEGLLATLDCLVMPSRETPTFVEGYSPVLLEAMARAVTPMVSDAGALPDLVGEAGVVFGSTEALAESLQRCVANPGRYRALGIKARRRVLEHFATPAVASRTVEFWRAVVADRSAAAI